MFLAAGPQMKRKRGQNPTSHFVIRLAPGLCGAMPDFTPRQEQGCG